MAIFKLDPKFSEAVSNATSNGLAAMVAEYHRDLQRTITINNDDGWLRSQPGNPPHHHHSGPDKRIFRDKVQGGWRIGVRGAAFHLFFQEKGTGPHRIEPVRAHMLRIPWRAEGRGRREPTEAEIQHLGLRHEKGEWVFYRPWVNHPGQQPRPWLMSTLRRFRSKYLTILSRPENWRPSRRTIIREGIEPASYLA